jgi:nickel-dependent lactate racemase
MPCSWNKGVEMTDKLKACPYCGHEPDSRISDTDGNKYYTCGSKWCRNGNWYALEEWNTRPLEDALQKSIDELKEYEQACFVARQKDEKLWVKALMALQEQPKLQKRIEELEIEKENWKAKYIKKIQEWKP